MLMLIRIEEMRGKTILEHLFSVVELYKYTYKGIYDIQHII